MVRKRVENIEVNRVQSSLAILFNVTCLDEYEIDIVEELEKILQYLNFTFLKFYLKIRKKYEVVKII